MATFVTEEHPEGAFLIEARLAIRQSRLIVTAGKNVSFMKTAAKVRRPISHAANGKLSKWTARGTAAQSTAEINERCRVAVEQARIARDDTRISIADSKALVALYGGRRGRC